MERGGKTPLRGAVLEILYLYSMVPLEEEIDLSAQFGPRVQQYVRQHSGGRYTDEAMETIMVEGERKGYLKRSDKGNYDLTEQGALCAFERLSKAALIH